MPRSAQLLQATPLLPAETCPGPGIPAQPEPAGRTLRRALGASGAPAQFGLLRPHLTSLVRSLILQDSPSLFASPWRHPPLTEGHGHSWREGWRTTRGVAVRVNAQGRTQGERGGTEETAQPPAGATRLYVPYAPVLVHVASRSDTSEGWLAQLRQAACADDSWQFDGFFSEVRGHALARLQADALRSINEPFLLGENLVLCSERQHLCVALDATDGSPQGYCAYSLTWCVGPAGRGSAALSLTLDVHEAWLAPSARRQQLGRRMQQWLAMTVQGAVADFQRKLGVRVREVQAQGCSLSTRAVDLDLVLRSGAGDGGAIQPSPASTMFLSELAARLHRELVQRTRASASGADGEGVGPAPKLLVSKVCWEG